MLVLKDWHCYDCHRWQGQREMRLWGSLLVTRMFGRVEDGALMMEGIEVEVDVVAEGVPPSLDSGQIEHDESASLPPEQLCRHHQHRPLFLH